MTEISLIVTLKNQFNSTQLRRTHVARTKANRDRHTDRQSDPYVALCFAGATKKKKHGVKNDKLTQMNLSLEL